MSVHYLRCPSCSQPSVQDRKWTPFCSARCKTIDLSRWLKGEYRVDSTADLDEEEVAALEALWAKMNASGPR